MSLLSKLTGSFFSATNETTLALSNLKFDFSLIKVEAPVEFNPLGLALSRDRKTEAEDGKQHQIARRLGALFEQIIPSTPKLISAYGKRVSEIINIPSVNPKGSPDKHGPFESFVGADATAMWASATSGTAAISVYLLACLLAEAWESEKAISIWVELIDERKKRILKAFEENGQVSAADLFSTRQEVTRDEIKLWDGSARSWLRSADDAKLKQRKQAILIFENISLPYPPGLTTYDKVINLWSDALKGMENLIDGQPQSILSQAVPLAIRSWHLYPDMLVLGEEVKNIRFNDATFSREATCTFGLYDSSRDQDCSSQWSLALSHLDYYGDPKIVVSHNRSERMTADEFIVAAWGSLLGYWDIPSSDWIPASRWICELWEVFEQPGLEDQIKSKLHDLHWLQILAKAAQIVLRAEINQDKSFLQILKFAARRGLNFLHGKLTPYRTTPFFGLSNLFKIMAISKTTTREEVIENLRRIAKHLPHVRNKLIIVSCDLYLTDPEHKYLQIMTALPIRTSTGQKDSNGHLEFEDIHHHWHVRFFETVSVGKNTGFSYRHSMPQDNELNMRNGYDYTIDKLSWACGSLDTSIHWKPPFPDDMVNLDPSHDDTTLRIVTADFVGKQYTTIVKNAEFALLMDLAHQPSTSSFGESLLTLSKQVPSSDFSEVSPVKLHNYFMCLTSPKYRWNSLFPDLCNAPDILPRPLSPYINSDCIDSLKVASFAYLLYQKLPNSTIPTQVVSRGKPLCSSQLHKVEDVWEGSERALRRNRKLAFFFILSFENSVININPDVLNDVFAICIENYLYVPKLLLSDPGSQVPDWILEQIPGNFGRGEISLLVGVQDPRTRALSNDYTIVSHESYDLRRENNFKGTSLHLSFTGWSLPLMNTLSETIRPRDHTISLVESVISVRDRGQLVADLDIHRFLREDSRLPVKSCSTIPNHDGSCKELLHEYISIDNWEELLDPPTNGNLVFRAHGNWSARLAAYIILLRSNSQRQVEICKHDSCLQCFDHDYEEDEKKNIIKKSRGKSRGKNRGKSKVKSDEIPARFIID
jgi:hypothetical protein